LSLHMPVGVMVILAIYTLRTVAGDTGAQLVWLVVAVAVTSALHVWRGHALLSIMFGTTCYVTLMSLWG
ncbi:branched-chain amino acid ABC transporter, partial [Mycobacterium sp. ITM-2017-0098]